jgi:8-oxo-dGTP pyrophosphatase MutT (NUDIX family)
VLALRERDSTLEVFMVRRDSRMGFLGGAHVFPGGALDERDCCDECLGLCEGFECLGPTERLHASANRAQGLLVAAVRELFEEAGILLARAGDGAWVNLDEDSERAHRLKAGREALSQGSGDLAALLSGEGLHIDVSGLRFFAHWITPEREKKRFDTRFFLARAPERQSARHCDIESTAGEWLAPAAALARYHAREIELVPPTIACLESLATFGGIDAALASYTSADVPCILPKLALGGDEITILYPGDADYDDGVAQPIAGRPHHRLVLRDGLWHRP